MVDSISARLDIDNTVLTKTISYKSFSIVEDMAYGSKTKTPKTYSLKAQVTIQGLSDKFVRQGVMSAGDAIGILRYEYTKETTGKTISPALVPKQAPISDELKFLNRWFRIKTLIPITSEDDGIICWEFTAVNISNEEQILTD